MIKLYKNSKYGFPIVSIILIITCTIVTIPTCFENELYHIFVMQSKPYFFWQIFSGIFEHSIFPSWFIWPHFLGNMSIVILLGILIERLIGSNKMLVLTVLAAISNVLFFQMRYKGQFNQGSGASGIVYAYAPIALYILIKYIKESKYNYKKDILFYILAAEFIFIWVFITAKSSWSGTNIYHFIATIVGVLFLISFKKQIDQELSSIILENNQIHSIPKSKWLYLIIILPLSMALVILLYKTDNLDEVFIEPISISAHDTIQDVVDNNNTIEIVFSEPITKFNSVSISGFGPSTMRYSEDRKTLCCNFPKGINYPYKIILNSAYSLNGRVVKEVIINVGE